MEKKVEKSGSLKWTSTGSLEYAEKKIWLTWTKLSLRLVLPSRLSRTTASGSEPFSSSWPTALTLSATGNFSSSFNQEQLYFDQCEMEKDLKISYTYCVGFTNIPFESGTQRSSLSHRKSLFVFLNIKKHH